jgi:protein-tyrosine phosphatase
MFQIFELSLGRGLLGISPLPGRSGAYDADLIAVLRWNPDLVISMTTRQEMAHRGAADLGADLINAGTDWAHLPVVNFGAPPSDVAEMWEKTSMRAHKVIAGKGRVLVHCQGGCGRSGMVALRLMAEAGQAPERALARLRQVRPCAVETDEQFRWAAAGGMDGWRAK